MLNVLVREGIDNYLEKSEKFLSSIWDVSYSNSLNITSWLTIKKSDEDKLDSLLFVLCVQNLFHYQVVTNYSNYTWSQLEENYLFTSATAKCYANLLSKSRSKEITINTWLKELTSLG